MGYYTVEKMSEVRCNSVGTWTKIDVLSQWTVNERCLQMIRIHTAAVRYNLKHRSKHTVTNFIHTK